VRQPEYSLVRAKSLSAGPRDLGDTASPQLGVNAAGLTSAPLGHPQCPETPCPSPGSKTREALLGQLGAVCGPLLAAGAGPLGQPGTGRGRAGHRAGCRVPLLLAELPQWCSLLGAEQFVLPRKCLCTVLLVGDRQVIITFVSMEYFKLRGVVQLM